MTSRLPPLRLFVRASIERKAWISALSAQNLQTERRELLTLLSGGAQFCLLPMRTSDEAIANCVGERPVYRTKRRFVFGNLEAALSEGRPRSGA